MEKARLLEAVKLLNGTVYEDEAKDAKVSLLATKIKIVAVKQEVIEAAFVAACQSLIDTPQEEHVPDLVSDVYNELVPQGDAPEAETESATAEAKKTEKKSDKPKKEKKEKKEKGEGAGRDKDAFNNVPGSMSGVINAMLELGTTKAEMVAALVKDFSRTEDKAGKKIKGHMGWLKAEGHTITEKGDNLKLTAKK